MPGINGEKQTGRDYSPHMWILKVGGDESRDDDYHYVGNTQADYWQDVEPDYFQDIDVEINSSQAQVVYRMGVNVLGEFVADRGIGEGHSYYHSFQGISVEDLPLEAKVEFLDKGVQEVGSVEGNMMLRLCSIELPENLKPLTLNDYMSNDGEVKAREEAWRQIKHDLTQQHFPEYLED